jgi:hypothetical protein
LTELGLQEDERLAMLEEEARQARLSKKNGLSQETPSLLFTKQQLEFLYTRGGVYFVLYMALLIS